MGELRPLSPYPLNFQMPYPIPGMDSGTQASQVRQPVVVDLLTSPDEKADHGNTSQAENLRKITENGGADPNDVQDTGKLEGLAPQSLCDDSSKLAEDNCCANQSTADAFEQSAVYTSANQHEISGSNTSVSSGQQPVIMNNSPSRSVKVSSLNNAVSGTVSRPDVSCYK